MGDSRAGGIATISTKGAPCSHIFLMSWRTVESNAKLSDFLWPLPMLPISRIPGSYQNVLRTGDFPPWPEPTTVMRRKSKTMSVLQADGSKAGRAPPAPANADVATEAASWTPQEKRSAFLISDVASRAGVSIATVSRVVNDEARGVSNGDARPKSRRSSRR